MSEPDLKILMDDCMSDPDNLSEAETRRLFIDKALSESHWRIGIDCKTEYALCGLSTPSGNGFADYVLMLDGKPVAVVEAKRTSVDPNIGWAQAKDYAESIYRATNEYPVIFLANGKTIIIDDGVYCPRVVSGFYSPSDLKRWLFTRKTRDWKFSSTRSLDNPDTTLSLRPPKFIEERLYQCMALNKTATAFARGNRRALLVMATGSGKTRVVNAISKILIEFHWATKILFLVDRKELVNQAGESFSKNIPTETISVIHSDVRDKNFDARIIVSCYPSMMTAIQNEKVDGKARFTPGYFDLVIIDEAHRSVYERYKNIMLHFDALYVGLTATPKDSIDRDTYELFEIYDKRPTFEYTLDEGVKDGYLCPPRLIRPRTSILTHGAEYEKLSEEDRIEYERAFTEDDGTLPMSKKAEDFYARIFNEDTLKIMFRQLDESGLRINHGNTLGKTIIFAPSHQYAELILDTFEKEYPTLRNKGYCRIVDYQTCGSGHGTRRNDAESDSVSNKEIDAFKNDPSFRIAITVDMMTTGVDIPELLNLVFYRKVGSNVLLQQMVGRGTRVCKGLIDGRDKTCFHIFDYCNNDFSGENLHDDPTANVSLSERIFKIKISLIFTLQDGDYSSDEYQEMRKELVDSIMRDITGIDKDNFIVKDFHLPYVLKYSDRSRFECITSEDIEEIRDHIAPIVSTMRLDIEAERFDAMMFLMEACALSGSQNPHCVNDLKKKASILYHDSATISDVKAKLPLLKSIMEDEHIHEWGAIRLEMIRKELRDLMKYIPKKSRGYISHLPDEVMGVDYEEIDLSAFGTADYRSKVNALIDKYSDTEVIQKIHRNEQLTEEDLEELQTILFVESGGTEESFKKAFGEISLVEVVRRHIGLDEHVVDEAFKEFILSHDLTDEMYYFVSQITKYLKTNGVLRKEQLLKPPFSFDINYLQKTFGDNMSEYLGYIGNILDSFNRGAGILV